jgi:serine/threonine-protein kinase
VNLLLPLERWDEARAELERARALEPLSPVISLSLGLVPFFQRNYEAAARIWREVLATDENFPLLHYFLGQTLALLDRTEEAVAALLRAAQLAGETAENTAVLGWVLARAGRRDEAERRLAELRRMAARQYVSPALPAQILASLGESEAALAAIGSAVDGRAADVVWLGVRPAFDSLRGNPVFGALLGRVGLG